MKDNIYTKPKKVINIQDCDFYHAMEIPGYGLVDYEWDLRGKEDEYLGKVQFKGKRVLEIGTASGYLSFYMEKKGADVISYDISPKQEWDIVPMMQYNYKKNIKIYKNNIRKLNNAYWFAHKIFNSKAKVVYGSVYNIPKKIGKVDLTTFGSILLHIRDPFLALQKAAKITKETIIVTDLAPNFRPFYPSGLFNRFITFIKRYLFFKKVDSDNNRVPYMVYLPNFRNLANKETWWYFSPEIIVNFFGTLGFEKSSISYHYQKYKDGSAVKFFTVVGKRTRAFNDA